MKNIQKIFDKYKKYIEEEELENFWATLKEVTQYDNSELADARSEEDWSRFPIYQDDWYKYYSTPVVGIYYAYISQGNWGNHYVVFCQHDIKDLEV